MPWGYLDNVEISGLATGGGFYSQSYYQTATLPTVLSTMYGGLNTCNVIPSTQLQFCRIALNADNMWQTPRAII